MISERCLGQTVHLSCTELPLSPNGLKRDFTWPISHRRYVSCVQNNFWAYGTFDTNRAPISHQDYHYLQTEQASSPRSTIFCIQNNFCAYGMFGANSTPILHWQYRCLQMDWNEIPHDQRHLGDPSGASKMISEPTVRSVQTVHVSCVKVSIISKQTKTSIHMSLVTYEYHRVRPKRFLYL
jgi:hypothetical protein